jgi:hypothetical protein
VPDALRRAPSQALDPPDAPDLPSRPCSPLAQGKAPLGPAEAPSVVIRAERNVFTFGAGVLDVAERAAAPDWIPPYREDKGALGADGLALRSGGPESGPEGEARRDSVDRDERRLGELGRKTVEMLAIAHIFCERLEVGGRRGGGRSWGWRRREGERGACAQAATAALAALRQRPRAGRVARPRAPRRRGPHRARPLLPLPTPAPPD